MLARGFLYKPPHDPSGLGDFLNIEQTWRFKVVKVWQGRENGGPHIEPLTGRAKLEKDSDHTTGYTINSSDPERRNAIAPFADGCEIVEKAVLYRTAAGMKLELWVDFQKVLEYEDRGQMGPDPRRQLRVPRLRVRGALHGPGGHRLPRRSDGRLPVQRHVDPLDRPHQTAIAVTHSFSADPRPSTIRPFKSERPTSAAPTS